MELYTSETIGDTSNTSTNNEISLSFSVENGGTETVYVEDKLLTNYDVAKSRAESILLDEGYITKKVTLSTYHIDNLHIGDTIQIDGLSFKVVSISEKIKGAKVSMDVSAERIPVKSYYYDVQLIIQYDTPEGYIYDIAELDGYLYAATGANGRIYKSELGSDTWSISYDDSTETTFRSLCVFGGYIYAGSGAVNGKIFRSADGISWSAVYTSSSQSILTLCAHSDGYIYAGSGAVDGKIFRSLDGVSWSMVWDTGQQAVYNLYSYGGYIYASTGSLGRLYRSADGLAWSIVYDFPDTNIYSFFYHDGAYYVTTQDYPSRILRSVDLVTWAAVFTSTTYDYYMMCLIAHSDGYLYAGSGSSGRIFRSADGIDWELYIDTPESYIQKLFQSSDGRFYAATGANGRIYADSLVTVEE